ncbi:hypothetical protein RDI58_010638 [Solanum bulbocastanum]|uniref:Calmodulin-binding domain-containing protein n=1 Tax=Solanum bulbocastanum TaxID=147425 RepID=A0AAN8TUS7_SOLBU
MRSLIIDMISAESAELDNKVICGAEDNHKDSGNKSCATESSDSFVCFSKRESMTTKQDANNQEIETRKCLAVKLVREAIERILLPEVQDHSLDTQLVTCEENSNESDTKNEECDKASKLDEGNVIGDNNGNPEKLRTFNPTKLQYLQLEPDPEAEKVNLKHQIEDERESNDDDKTQENSMNLSECKATESITVSSDENEKITEEEDDNGGYRKQVKNRSTSARGISYHSTFFQSVTNDIVQDEEQSKSNHTNDRVENSTNSLYESLRHHDSQLETTNFVANNSITESKFEPPKSKNWSNTKKLILLKRSIKLESLQINCINKPTTTKKAFRETERTN